MSNILAVQDSNNDLGIGTNSINLISTENFKFIDNNNNTYLEFNTSNNTVGVGTVKKSTWNATPISTAYGGTGLTQINGTSSQLLSVKSDRSGLEFTNNLMNIKTVTNIAHLAQSNITIGNISYGFNLNSSNNFKINSTPTNNQVLGYKDKTVKFIDENQVNTTDDLWSIMNIFYPGYKYLLMNLTIQKKDTTVNLIEFIPTKYNYIVTVVNTSPIITIKPEVFNDSTIQLRHDVNLESLSDYATITTNSENDFTLTSSTDPEGIITRNFNFRIANYDSQIYTLQVLQKVITVTITGHTDESVTNSNKLTADYYNGPIYIKITFSDIVIDFNENKITKIQSFDSFDITNFSQESYGLIYSFTLTPTPVGNSENTCRLKINYGEVTDNQQNVNRESNVFSFTYDTIHPTMEITAFSDETLTNSISDNTLTNLLNKIYLKFTPSEETINFVSSSITYKLDDSNILTNNHPSITSIDNTNNFKSELNFTNDGTYSIEVEQNKFNDVATNNNNNPSNTFNIRIDTTPPTVSISASDGYYKAGDIISISLTFDDNVVATNAKLNLSNNAETDPETTTASSITFTYTVQQSDTNTTNLSISSYAGEIKDLAGNNADPISESLGSVIIDTISPDLTQVTPISTPSNDTTPSYVFTTSKSGILTTNITQGFSTSSSVITDSNQTVTFNTLGSGTYSGKTITVTDAAGNATNLPIPEFIIDTTPPTVTDTTTVDGYYTVNDIINISLTFDKDVTATDAKLNLSNGAETDTVTTTASNSITFTYTVQESDTNTTNLSISSYDDEIKDLAGNSASAISESLKSLENVIINISNNTTPDKIIIKYNNNEEIVTLNSELSNTEHTIFDQNTNTTDIMNIDVHRDGRQQVHFIKTSGNSNDENDSRGTTNISNIEFFSNNTDSTSNKNINLKNNCGTYRIVLKITAENGDEQLYKINIIKLIYFGLDPNIETTQSIISNILPNYYTQSITNITYKLQCVYSYSNNKRPHLSPYIGPGESSHYTNFVGEAEGSNPSGPGFIETKSRIGRSLLQYKLTDIIRADDNALYANIVHITDNVAYKINPHYIGAHIHWGGIVYSNNGFMDNNGNIQNTRSVNLAQHLDSNGNYNNDPNYPHDFNNYNSVTKRRWILPIYNNHSKYNNIFRVKLHYQDSAGTFAIQNIGGGNALGSNSGNLSSDNNFISLINDSWNWSSSSDLSLIDAVLWKSGTLTDSSTNTEGAISIISDLTQKWEFISDTTAPTVQTNGITVTSGIKTYIYNYSNNTIDINIQFSEDVVATGAKLILSNNAETNAVSTTASDSITFSYTIQQSDNNDDNLSISSFSGSITDLAGNNCSGISGSLGGVKVVVLSSFGLSDIENKVLIMQQETGGGGSTNEYQPRRLKIWESTHPAGNTTCTTFVGVYGTWYNTLYDFILHDIVYVNNTTLKANIRYSTNLHARNRATGNRDSAQGIVSVGRHMDDDTYISDGLRGFTYGDNIPHHYTFNNNLYQTPSTDTDGAYRVKIELIPGSSPKRFYIRHLNNNKYLVINYSFFSSSGIDPVFWSDKTIPEIGKEWAFI